MSGLGSIGCAHPFYRFVGHAVETDLGNFLWWFTHIPKRGPRPIAFGSSWKQDRSFLIAGLAFMMLQLHSKRNPHAEGGNSILLASVQQARKYQKGELHSLSQVVISQWQVFASLSTVVYQALLDEPNKWIENF